MIPMWTVEHVAVRRQHRRKYPRVDDKKIREQEHPVPHEDAPP